MLAPAAFVNLGYDFGRYDHVNFLLLAASLYGLAQSRMAGVCALTVVALLIHEAYLFYGVPLIALCLRDGRYRVSRGQTMALTASIAATLLALACRGRFEAGREALVASLADQLDDSGHNAVNVWLRTLGENLVYVGQRWSQSLFDSLDIALMIALLLAPAGLLFGVYRSNGRRPAPACLVPLAVLPLFALGVDYARWLALAWLMACALISWQLLYGGFTRLLAPRAAFGVLGVVVATAVLGPVGVVHVFPLLRSAFAG